MLYNQINWTFLIFFQVDLEQQTKMICGVVNIKKIK